MKTKSIKKYALKERQEKAAEMMIPTRIPDYGLQASLAIIRQLEAERDIYNLKKPKRWWQF